MRPNSEGRRGSFGRLGQEDRPHPEIDAVGTVEQRQAEGHHCQQGKQQYLDSKRSISAD
jgi:hypothetical protein